MLTLPLHFSVHFPNCFHVYDPLSPARHPILLHCNERVLWCVPPFHYSLASTLWFILELLTLFSVGHAVKPNPNLRQTTIFVSPLTCKAISQPQCQPTRNRWVLWFLYSVRLMFLSYFTHSHLTLWFHLPALSPSIYILLREPPIPHLSATVCIRATCFCNCILFFLFM